MKSKNPFKIIFWILLVFIVLILPSPFLFTLSQGFSENTNIFDEPEILIFFAIAIFAILILFFIGRFVFKDATKRNLDPWMWMTIAVFVPNLLGLIIYLLIRNNHVSSSKKCLNCGRTLNSDFKICPYCGSNLSRHCPQCNNEICSEWKVCPHCGTGINEQ